MPGASEMYGQILGDPTEVPYGGQSELPLRLTVAMTDPYAEASQQAAEAEQGQAQDPAMTQVPARDTQERQRQTGRNSLVREPHWTGRLLRFASRLGGVGLRPLMV